MLKLFSLKQTYTIKIIQMRENGAKVMTSMIDVQLKIILEFQKQTLINDTNWENDLIDFFLISQLYYSNLITYQVNENCHKALHLLYIPFQSFRSFFINLHQCSRFTLSQIDIVNLFDNIIQFDLIGDISHLTV